MQIFKILQTNFVRNQKLSKTQNNPKKLLKLIQIQTNFILFYKKIVETRDYKCDCLQFCPISWLQNVKGVFKSFILQFFL